MTRGNAKVRYSLIFVYIDTDYFYIMWRVRYINMDMLTLIFKNLIIHVFPDTNECLETETPCGANEKCVNLIPGHRCDCKEGFIRKFDECEPRGKGT